MTKETTTKEQQDTGFTLDLGGDTSANLPATTGGNAVTTSNNGTGGLTYQNATDAERKEMDDYMATIDLTNPETVIALGSKKREKLADLADAILDSVQPSVKLAFAEALGSLIRVVQANSLAEVKKRITDGAISKAFKGMYNALTRKDNKVEVAKSTIERFMTDISTSRKTIEEMVDKLKEQQVELNKNYVRINTLGAEMNEAAQGMRVERAAAAEYIRRVEAGEITVLADLEAKAHESGRADDMEKLQLAQASWNNLRVVDGDMLASIGVYDMNVANLAFTKQANIQNRMQTANTLTTTIAEWKSQLAMFAVVTTETAATQLLGAASQLTEQSLKANKDLFDTLVDATIKNAGKGTYSLRGIVDQQGAMLTKLNSVGPAIEAQFKQLADDKKKLEESSAAFRKGTVAVFSNKNGVLSTPTPAATKPKL